MFVSRTIHSKNALRHLGEGITALMRLLNCFSFAPADSLKAGSCRPDPARMARVAKPLRK